MKTWETIRLRCRRDKEQIKPLARELGISPNTVRKYLRLDTPPKRAATPRAKLLDPYQSHIDALLQSTPKITPKRIGGYLRQNVDAEIAVDERTLRQYVADRRSILVPEEAFIRASYAPGDQSQFDCFSFAKTQALVESLIDLTRREYVRKSRCCLPVPPLVR